MIRETKACPPQGTPPFRPDQGQSKLRLTANPLTKPLKAFQRAAIIFITFFLIMGFQTFYNWCYVSDFADSGIYLLGLIYSILCIVIGIIALLFKQKFMTIPPDKQWWQNYNQISIFLQFIGLIYHAQ